jgi:hypothetical protein
MNINKIQNIINFARLIPNHHDIAYKYNYLLKLSKKLSTIDTHACNGTKYTTDDVYNDATEKVFDKIRIVLLTTRLHFYHQSDPRGASLYVSKEKLTHDNYSSKGLAIY